MNSSPLTQDPVSIHDAACVPEPAVKFAASIVRYADGYGFTYGVRTSAVNTLGLGERWSIPLTWGATRSAALELERAFDGGALTSVRTGFGVTREINPHYAESDFRVTWGVRADRRLGAFRVAADAATSRVHFQGLSEREWTAGATLAVDTRGNPGFPSNAIYVTAGWRALWREDRPATGIALADARGYWRPAGRAVIAARLRYEGAAGALPPCERLLVGGAESLRGEPTGRFAGDRALAASGELRVPLRPAGSLIQWGSTIFIDTAKAFDAGQPASGTRWARGAGVGFFAVVPMITTNLHLARSFDGGPIRAHVSFGFAF